jgi:hypothetical protein
MDLSELHSAVPTRNKFFVAYFGTRSCAHSHVHQAQRAVAVAASGCISFKRGHALARFPKHAQVSSRRLIGGLTPDLKMFIQVCIFQNTLEHPEP